jgi:hypothetical protein
MTAGQAGAWLHAHEQEATPESVREMAELSASMGNFEFVPDPNAHLGVMGGLALRISGLFLPRPWWIAEYDQSALLTSDHPIALHFRGRSCPPGHDRGIAYADEIWFSSTHTGCSSWADPVTRCREQRLRPPAKTAVTVNLTVAAGAYEHIYMHPAQDHLQGLRLPKPVPSSGSAGTCPSISDGTTSLSPAPAPPAARNSRTQQAPGRPGPVPNGDAPARPYGRRNQGLPRRGPRRRSHFGPAAGGTRRDRGSHGKEAPLEACRSLPRRQGRS